MPALAYSVSLKSIDAIFGGGFSPVDLFSSGEQGAWYDPSDFSTMFQDSAGTTPVTAVEQPVGLLLDKSKGLALGAELVTNGDFSGGSTGWTNASIGTGTFTVSSGVATLIGVDAANRGALLQAITCVVGTTYKVTATVSGGSLNIAVGTGVLLDGTGGVSVTQTGAVSFVVVASATSLNLKAWNIGAGGTVTIDNLSVKALPGNHASQSTAASRPVLSARVNLLTYSEQFDNSYWTKNGLLAFGSGSIANAVVAPDGTLTADKIVETAAANWHGLYSGFTAAAGQTWSVYLKAAERTYVQIFDPSNGRFGQLSIDLSNGTVTQNTSSLEVSVIAAGNGWYRVIVKPIATCLNAGVSLLNTSTATSAYGSSYTGDGTSGVYLWGADLRVTNTGVGIPTYQRIAAATDYDTSGFPLALKFDGVDDSLATGTIDPGAVGKAQVFAGVRKLSDAANGLIAEWSVNATANNGVFNLFAPVAGAYNYRFFSKGTVSAASGPTIGYGAPLTSVLTGIGDISGDVSRMNVNGTLIEQVVTDQGTGNFLSHPLHIGRRADFTSPYNGHLYSLIVRFSAANLSDAQIASTENYVNSKAKAY